MICTILHLDRRSAQDTGPPTRRRTFPKVAPRARGPAPQAAGPHAGDPFPRYCWLTTFRGRSSPVLGHFCQPSRRKGPFSCSFLGPHPLRIEFANSIFPSAWHLPRRRGPGARHLQRALGMETRTTSTRSTHRRSTRKCLAPSAPTGLGARHLHRALGAGTRTTSTRCPHRRSTPKCLAPSAPTSPGARHLHRTLGAGTRITSSRSTRRRSIPKCLAP